MSCPTRLVSVFSSLFFPIHLYPLMLLLLYESLFSQNRAIPMFSHWMRDSRLLILHFVPFILMAAMVSIEFFLILFLFSGVSFPGYWVFFTFVPVTSHPAIVWAGCSVASHFVRFRAWCPVFFLYCGLGWVVFCILMFCSDGHVELGCLVGLLSFPSLS